MSRPEDEQEPMRVIEEFVGKLDGAVAAAWRVSVADMNAMAAREGYDPQERRQLLEACAARMAEWRVTEGARLASTILQEFGISVPPEQLAPRSLDLILAIPADEA
jgi:hypothetical protein